MSIEKSDCKIQEKHTSQLVVLRMTFGYQELPKLPLDGFDFFDNDIESDFKL